MDYINLLEPSSVVRNFLDNPPAGFVTFESPEGVPGFSTRFDLTTTVERAVRKTLRGLPLYQQWRWLLKPRTCFIGTTVSEYAVFPPSIEPARFVHSIKEHYAVDCAFLIIKDLPQASPLLSATSSALAHELAAACEREGFVLIEGQALAYVPIDFLSIEDYISRLSASRRKDLRRKLRSRLPLEVAAVSCGSERFGNERVLQEYYELYLNVYHQSELHFDLLSEIFFRNLLRDASSGGIVFEYRHGGRLIGYNICFVSAGMLIDKYVGFRYPEARAFNLYFVSWFHNLAYALELGLSHYVAGWTDPEIKAYLGARFTFTRHAVYVRNKVLRSLFRRLAGYFESDRIWQVTNADGITTGRS
jgi:predicted N-acyltransferase